MYVSVCVIIYLHRLAEVLRLTLQTFGESGRHYLFNILIVLASECDYTSTHVLSVVYWLSSSKKRFFVRGGTKL